MNILISRAADTDVPQIEALVEEAYSHYIDRIGSPPAPMLDDYASYVREHDAFIARSHTGVMVGLLVLIVFDGFMLLDNVAVETSAQGQGIGKGLMAYAEKIACEQGFREIRLYTHESMVENQAIYAHLGYEEFERRVEKGLARVYMRKFLTR